MALLSFDAPLEQTSKAWLSTQEWEAKGRRVIVSAKPNFRGLFHIDDTYDLAQAARDHQEWLKSGMPF